MSLLSDYEQRTAWKYEPIHGSFHTHEGLSQKVNPDGSYASFPGSTVVFRLESQCLQIIQLMQKMLYHKLGGDMLASILPASSLHMTLHDLISREMCASHTEEGYRAKVAESLDRAAAIAEGIRKDYAGQTITMTADQIVNMVSKSLVLLLKPQTEQDYELLLKIYGQFDAIIRLPYPLTPHITLAYFKPGMLDGECLGKALDFAQIHRENAPVFTFRPESLTAQSFLDMQSYLDIPKRICFCCDGGLNRSVMAANIVNHLARERNLPVMGAARSAYPNTQGWPVSEEVWGILEEHGINPDRSYSAAKYLEDEEIPFFSDFAAITTGAMERMSWLCLPEEKFHRVSRLFCGVRDPEYGEITRRQAFDELYERAVNYLDAFETEYRKYVKK